MDNTINITNTQIGKLVVQHPILQQVFESFNIDYCCHGNRTLKEATDAINQDMPTVIAAIEKALDKSIQTHNTTPSIWQEENLTKLVNHIESKHHTFVKNELPRLEGLFHKVLQAHKDHKTFTEIALSAYLDLKKELDAHLMKEEQILFPYIRQMVMSMQETDSIPPMHCGSVQHPIRQMQAEHVETAHILERLKFTTNNYTPPEGTCLTYKALFDGLRALELDLHEHIHLENNILFPRAVNIESEYSSKLVTS